MSHHKDTIEETRIFLENMVGFALNAQKAGIEITPKQAVDSTLGKVVEIAEQHFPLAKVLDDSDIVLHAEGPGAAGSPWLSALNWVTSTAELNIRKLATAFFDMKGADGKKIAKDLDPRLTGIAPGSIWLGIKINRVADPFDEIIQGQATLHDEIRNLPTLARFIDDEGMRSGFEDASPDPAMRDISLSALYRFSPTGRKGIHTLEIATDSTGLVALGQRERVVLKDQIDKPTMRKAKPGSFIGEIRGADLDTTRIHLRHIKGVGTLRCVVPELNAAQAASLLGRTVKVVGNYQSDALGRPRLMFVDRFEEASPPTVQSFLDF